MLQGGHSDKQHVAGGLERDLGDRSHPGGAEIGVEQHYLDNVMKQLE